MAKITYTDKILGKINTQPENKKFTFQNANEVKTSVNALYDEKYDASNPDGYINEVNWGDIGGTLANQTDLQDALDEKIGIDSLNANIIVYPTTANADVPTYFKLVDDLADPDYNSIAVDVPTGIITGSNQLLSSLISDEGLIEGEIGIINVTIVGNIRKTSGSGTSNFYFEIYKRTDLGVESLLATSSNTLPVNSEIYVQFFDTALINDGPFSITDRIVLKFYANRIAGGSDPSFEFQFGGVTPIRALIPIPLVAVPSDAHNDLNGLQGGTIGEFYHITEAEKTILENTSGTNTGDQDISGIATNASAISDIELEQITQNDAIALNTAKRSYPLDDETRLANTSGTNTGDQDISGIATNASAISDLDTNKQDILAEGAFVDGDKTKLDAIEGTNTGDETTLSIQTKRPLKTINSESLEGIGNIVISGGGGGIGGSGTLNYVPKFTPDGATLGNSRLIDDGTSVYFINQGTSTHFGYKAGNLDPFVTNSDNTSFGFFAGRIATGTRWTAIGDSAGFSNTTGSQWTAVGQGAATNNVTGSYWTAVGQGAGEGMLGDSWVAIGTGAGLKNTTGLNTVIIGRNAAYNNSAGGFATSFTNGVYIGTITKVGGVGATNEIVIGYLAQGEGSNKTVIGNSSTTDTHLYGQLRIDTVNNVASATNLTSVTATGVVQKSRLIDDGTSAYFSNQSLQTHFGLNAGNSAPTNSFTTSFGYLAGNSATGVDWVAVGAQAGQNNVSGVAWTAVGEQAGDSATGSRWTGIGQRAGFLATGNNWTAVGSGAGLINSGSNWIAIGYQSALNNTGGGSASSYSNGIYIGYQNTVGGVGATNEIVIGYLAQGEGSNKTVIGNSSTTDTHLYGQLQVENINNAVGDFITTSATGVLQKRTATEVKDDLEIGQFTTIERQSNTAIFDGNYIIGNTTVISGNILFDFTGAKLGSTTWMYHDNSGAYTFPTEGVVYDFKIADLSGITGTILFALTITDTTLGSEVIQIRLSLTEAQMP